MAEAGSQSRHRRSLLRYRAERLMRKDFSGLRSQVTARVRARLARSGTRLPDADLDACYTQAWHALYAAMLDGEQIDDVAAWLVVVTFRRAVDELRTRERQEALSGGPGERLRGRGAERAWEPDEIAGGLDDLARIRQVFEGLVEALGPRERRIAALCYLHGLTRAQAAREVGVSERRMRKLMDGSPGKPGVAAKVGAVLAAVGAGEWCERHESLMRAYALHMLAPDGGRHRFARAHAQECPRCRALVLFLRGLAIVLPPLPLPLRPAGPTRVRAAARGVRPLVHKFAAAALLALGVAGGYALLGAHGEVHMAQRSVSSHHRVLLSHSAPASRHKRHRRRPVRHRRESQAVAIAPPPMRLAISAVPAPPRAPAPQGEFTPERPRRR